MNIYWVTGFSFLSGLFGYIIVRFWILPIGRYRKVKRLLYRQLKVYWEMLPRDGAARLKGPVGKKIMRDIRRLGVRLVEVHDADLPYWYRLLLMTRKEAPGKATDPILRLENMPTSLQARRCIKDIGCHMGFKPFESL